MPPVTPAGALVGRDSEITLLTELVREVSAGRGSSVLIEGEPGISKSALVRAVVAGAPEAGCQVFWGSGDELGQALPLVPFLDGLEVREPSTNPRRNTIVRLLRGEVTADRGTDVPAALAEQLLALVTEQCTTRPTILVVDDLQWADPASVTLWGRLARQVLLLPGRRARYCGRRTCWAWSSRSPIWRSRWAAGRRTWFQRWTRHATAAS